MRGARVRVWEMDSSSGSSVTLIYYRIGERWWKEPFLNVVAAAAQMSALTHVEISIGEEPGANGMMSNVCRVFNDQVGVELVERTGRSPHYVYQSLGCSKTAVDRMLRFAKTQCVGKPFSNTGMARSLLWPRQSDYSSFYCAELVAAILKEGGLLEASSNPGSATPETLHRIYQSRAAATANPYVLRDLSATTALSFSNTVGLGHAAAVPGAAEEREALLVSHGATSMPPPSSSSNRIVRWRDASPPRGHFRVVSSVGAARCAYGHHPNADASSSGGLAGGGSSGQTGRVVRAAAAAAAASADAPVRRGPRTGLNLTLHSLDMRAPGRS